MCFYSANLHTCFLNIFFQNTFKIVILYHIYIYIYIYITYYNIPIYTYIHIYIRGKPELKRRSTSQSDLWINQTHAMLTSFYYVTLQYDVIGVQG